MQNKNDLHPEDRRNLILFLAISVCVWFTYDYFLLKPKAEAIRKAQQAQEKLAADLAQAKAEGTLAEEDMPDTSRAREEILTESLRLSIENDLVQGSISLKGGRLDDLTLKKYYASLAQDQNIHLLSPSGSLHTRYVETGWLGSGDGITVPNKETRWTASGNKDLSPGNPVTLRWTSTGGIRFERTFEIDENYLVTITDRAVNTGSKATRLFPFALVAERGEPLVQEENSRVVHEGPIGYIDGDLKEFSYNKMPEDHPKEVFSATSGWAGITEKYWLTALLPEQSKPYEYRFQYVGPGGKQFRKGLYQTDMRGEALELAPGESVSHTMRVYAGAKKLRLLDRYAENLQVRHFDLALDFGLFYFLTKPFFLALNFIASYVGNFGIAIILLCIALRIAVFPLANTSFKSFARLKKVTPQMMELREKYGDDKQKLQQEFVKLYEREKVNPMAGCLPILLQIPIFFALFKVLSVTIEMRHAPFYGWIQDLSAPDPTSVFNLFGLIPFDPPSFLMIGAWPCIMLFTMIAQRKMNPPPQDPVQAQMMALMPWVMTFILSRFAAGLVIYWSVSNLFSMIQQYIIMRSMGVEVSFIHKNKDEKKLEEMVEDGPKIHPEAEMLQHDIEESMGLEQEESKPVTPPKRKPKRKKKS